MRKTKKIANTYARWEGDKAVARLDDLSKEGWQLKKAGLSFTLVRDTEKVYRYQMDFKEKADKRYYDTFAEQGWEQVCEYMGEHWFRKEYDSSLPESDYEIYTDDESYEYAVKKSGKTYWALAVIYAMVTLAYLFGNRGRFDATIVVSIVAFAMIAAVNLLGAISVWRKAKDRTRKIWFTGKGVWVVLMLTLVMVIAVPTISIDRGFRTVLDTNMAWAECIGDDLTDSGVTHELKFDVKTGTHQLDIQYSCEEAPISVEILDSEGNVIYRTEPALECKVSGEKLQLEEGTYFANIYAEKGSKNAKFSIDLLRLRFGCI